MFVKGAEKMLLLVYIIYLLASTILATTVTGSSISIIILGGQGRKQNEPKEADRRHEGYSQMFGNERKGNGLGRYPNRPIIQ